MNALPAEINSHSRAESIYYVKETESEASQSIELINRLHKHLGPDKPRAAYVAKVLGNPVFENVLTSLSLLPARAGAANHQAL
jgi:hypothetical protein